MSSQENETIDKVDSADKGVKTWSTPKVEELNVTAHTQVNLYYGGGDGTYTGS